MPVANVIYQFKNQFTLVRAQIILVLEVREIRLSPREVDAFTWIVIEGWSDETHEKIRQLKILKGNGINNLGSKLIALKLLVQPKKGLKTLPSDIQILKEGFLKAGFCTVSYVNQLKNGREKTDSIN